MLATVIIYGVFLQYGFISWDDPEMVFRNKAVQNFSITDFFKNQYVGNYIPFTMLLHSLIWQIAGDHAGVHHLFSLLLHLLNGWLVYQLGRKLFQQDGIAAIGMLIFLTHPIQMESVGWISELKTILYSTFFLAGLLAYLQYRTDARTKNLLLVFFYFIAACLSKPSAVVFPIVLFCIELFLSDEKRKSLRPIFIPFFILAILFGLINLYTQTQAQFLNQAHAFPYWQRFAFAGFALGKYLLLFLLPVNLSVIYPYPMSSAAVLGTGGLILLSLTALVYWAWSKNRKLILFATLFFLSQLLLVLQFIPFGEALYADRYLYLPVIALGWLAGNFIVSLKVPLRYASLILIILLTLPGTARARDWRTALVLFEDIIKHYPESFVALNSAGVESMYQNLDEKAKVYFDRAIAVNTNNYKGFYNRGLLALKTGHATEAVQDFNKCLALNAYVKAYSGRANAYYQLQDYAKAIEDAEQAIIVDPGYAKSFFILGNCYNDMGQMDIAIQNYNKAIALQVEEADFYFKRAIAYGKKQDFQTCLSDLDVCTTLNPLYYEAYYWKGVAKVNLGKNACEDFRIAARQNFEPAVAAFNKYCR